jgi:hypothetical protein
MHFRIVQDYFTTQIALLQWVKTIILDILQPLGLEILFALVTTLILITGIALMYLTLMKELMMKL